MTREDIKAIPGVARFLAFVVLPDGTVAFGLPIPGMPTASTTTDDGCTIPSCTTVTELAECKAAWDNYIRDLTGTVMEPDSDNGTDWVMPTDDELHEILGTEYVTKAEYDALHAQTQEPTPEPEPEPISAPDGKHRSRKKAAEHGAITLSEMPDEMIIPTSPAYRTALQATPSEKITRLIKLMPQIMAQLTVKDGVVVNGDKIRILSTKFKNVELSLNYPLLQALYSVIFTHFENDIISKTPDEIQRMVSNPDYLNRGVDIYMPDFIRMMGFTQNTSDTFIENIVKQIAVFGIVLGAYTPKGGHASYYPVLQMHRYNGDKNILTVSSPWINALIARSIGSSIKLDKHGMPEVTKAGKAVMLPSHSYMIKSSIESQKNKRAIEIVVAIVTVIETAGDGTPHITYKELLNRCPELLTAYQLSDDANKSNVLRRAFAGANEMLVKHTYLFQTYKNLQIPKMQPSVRNLNVVIEFPHDGKIKK